MNTKKNIIVFLLVFIFINGFSSTGHSLQLVSNDNSLTKKNKDSNRSYFSSLKKTFKFLYGIAITNYQIISAMWKLSKIDKPTVTFFGGNRVPDDSPFVKKSDELSRSLVENGFAILTGGGYGIMGAANNGAFEVSEELGRKEGDSPVSFGISLSMFPEESLNNKLHDYILMKHFFARKLMMTRQSIAFVAFPGGVGTIDELFEIITLEQTGAMEKFPIILMCKDYWEPIIDWMKNKALANKLISEKDLDLVYVTDSVDDAVQIIIKYHIDSQFVELS